MANLLWVIDPYVKWVLDFPGQSQNGSPTLWTGRDNFMMLDGPKLGLQPIGKGLVSMVSTDRPRALKPQKAYCIGS